MANKRILVTLSDEDAAPRRRTRLELTNEYRQGFYDEWLDPTQKIIMGFIFVLAVVIILPYLPGYKSPAFCVISIFFCVIFSLGSTSLVSHIVAGYSALRDGNTTTIPEDQRPKDYTPPPFNIFKR